MNIKLTKTFATRDELDSYVKSRFGDDASKNLDVTLELAPEEMQALALDESTTVHGAKVVAITEEETEVKSVNLGSRGVPAKKKKGRVSKK